MSVWDGPEDGPGTTDSLYVLYYLMPIAEELDLVDELHASRRAREQELVDDIFPNFCDDGWDPESKDGDSEPADDTDAMALTLGQLSGLLEHYLGAELLSDDEDELPGA